MRYEIFGQAINELHDLSVARESNPATAIWDKTLPLSARTLPSIGNKYTNFEPRIGFAYNPAFDKKLVIRGGYSIGYDPAFYNLFLNVATVAPVATSASFACGGTCLGSGDFTGAGLRATNLKHLPIGGNPAFADQEFVPPNFHNPYLETYSFGAEHQVTSHLLFVARYVGSHGVGNFQSLDANPNLAPVKAAFPKFNTGTLCTTAGAPGTVPDPIFGTPVARPNCNLGNLALVGNTGFSIYNSFQSQISASNFHGFTGTINYTFSHSVDNSSEVYSTGAGGNTISLPQNPQNPNFGERGTSGFSLPNNLSIGMTYAVHGFQTGSAYANKLINGVQLNAIYQVSSGQPFNPYQPILGFYGLSNSLCDNTFNASSVGPGADSCRLVLSNKNAPIDSVAVLYGGTSYDLGSLLYTANPVPLATSAAHWVINNSDYATQVGNPYPGSGRNILRAQTYNNLDASFFKDTKIHEKVVLEFQVNAYNALNRQFRGTPLANAALDIPGYAPNLFLSNAYNNSNSRQVQFGAKVKF